MTETEMKRQAQHAVDVFRTKTDIDGRGAAEEQFVKNIFWLVERADPYAEGVSGHPLRDSIIEALKEAPSPPSPQAKSMGVRDE